MPHDSTPGTATRIQRSRLYEDRWSSYGTHADILSFSERPSPKVLRSFTPFQDLNDALLEELSPDISIAEWRKDAVLFEEGSYLDLAFYVVKGQVDLYLQKHRETAAEPIFHVERTSFDSGERQAATEDAAAQTVFMTQIESQQKRVDQNHEISYLSSIDFNLTQGEVVQEGPGALFGEIGALNGWPQSVTARAATNCTLVQIRVPALRELKKKSSALKTWIDRVYRERALFAQLNTTPIFRGTSPDFIDRLTEQVELVSCSPGEEITREGEPADALYLVRSGFFKISQRIGAGEGVTSYLSKGMTLGEAELLLEDVQGWQSTATSVGYTELVRIPNTVLRPALREYPVVERRLWRAAIDRIKDSGYTRKHLEKSALIEFALAKGLVQGNSMLVIDLDVCTRCDDCVRGCASTHGGRPRFLREGDRFQNFLIARSCYHCEDPVCLIGCPTGAIRRANVAEVVAIDDNLCIGCSNCAQKCPYDAIIMHETGTAWPADMVPVWLRGRERKVASKCDLCHTSSAGPACVNNCPHACAFRVSNLEEFQQLLATESENS